MNELRRFLMFTRKQSVKYENRTKTIFSILFLSIIICFLIDIFLPYNSFMQFIRAIAALALGVYSFMICYILSIKYSDNAINKDENYLPQRKRYSHNQRKNIAIFSCLPLMIIIFMFASSASPIYTLMSSVSIVYILVIFSFVRTYRNEEIKIQNNIPDVRDLNFKRKINEYNQKTKEITKETKEKKKK